MVFPAIILLFVYPFSSRITSFPTMSVSSATRRHSEFAEFKLENISLMFSSFNRKFAHAQLLTVSPCTLHSGFYTLHPPPCILQSAHCTMHHACIYTLPPCVLQTASCTCIFHPSPYTLLNCLAASSSLLSMF